MTSKISSSWINNVKNETLRAQQQHKINEEYFAQKQADIEVEYFKRLVETQAAKGQNQMWIPNQSNYVINKFKLLGLDIQSIQHSKDYCFGNALDEDCYYNDHFETNQDNKDNCILCNSHPNDTGFMLTW